MASLRVLFVGGTGVISSACVRAAVARGYDVTVLNRGTTTVRPLPADAESLVADIRDVESVDAVVSQRDFDVVADFMSFTPDHVQAHIDRWRDRTGQYIFISSASAYQTPPAQLPVVESTPLRNPFWEYSRNKIACEDLLVGTYRSHGFPMTIVRPSHTYDRTLVPFDGGWTVIERMRRGAPIVVHGDGTSLWTITYNEDFAAAFVGLLGDPRAIGQSYHITSDEALPWNQIAAAMASALEVEPRIVHVTSDAIAAVDPVWGASLLGDKTHSMVFDNTKIKRMVPGWKAEVPFWQGARRIVEWHEADPARRVLNPAVEDVMDHLIARFGPTGPA